MNARTMTVLGAASLLLSLMLVAGPAFAAPIIGLASVIVEDTIEIHGQRIRLHGIDAPEGRQLCTRPTGEGWRCGQRASLALSDQIGRSTVSCDLWIGVQGGTPIIIPVSY